MALLVNIVLEVHVPFVSAYCCASSDVEMRLLCVVCMHKFNSSDSHSQDLQLFFFP